MFELFIIIVFVTIFLLDYRELKIAQAVVFLTSVFMYFIKEIDLGILNIEYQFSIFLCLVLSALLLIYDNIVAYKSSEGEE